MQPTVSNCVAANITVWRVYHTFSGTATAAEGTAAYGTAEEGTVFWGQLPPPPSGTAIMIR